ncbi:protein translocase subunit SecY [Collibacillus ludicampi]|uniref:Protein translocase subunit SecY n=2 Tax=Collibacillus ludicampi TaxID=2771369 RepID=A0AAV4LEP2_9BACL|nr:protein translocase subunit SecY [Collibacillus ludicampi]
MMFTAIRNVWKMTDLRRRILFTLAMLAVFRIGTFIPVPNVNASLLAERLASNQIFGLLNTFSGGALQYFSIFAMSVTPYITSSIIVQLLQHGVVKKFEDWSKEGEHGRRKLLQITRYGTVLLALIQSVGLSISFNRQIPGLVIDPSFRTYALIALTLTAGATFLMWIGEQITDKGIGNGISLLIFAGIIAGVEKGVRQIYATWFYEHPEQLTLNIVKLALLVIGVLLIIVGVIYVQEGVRRIPVQYAKRVVGRKLYGGQSTHIPMKVNAAGVIPVIFASSLLIFPATVASWFKPNAVTLWIQANLTFGTPLYVTLEALLVIAFTYFYTYIQINPEQLTEQMQKNAGFIPGIRPGEPTMRFITRVMNRITLFGALFLAAVTVLPVLFMKATGLNLYFGGTSLLIVVGVALDTMKQVEAQLLQRHYKGFIR